MLSEREKRIIQVKGEIEYYKEIMLELYYKDEPLDERETEILRAAIEHLTELEEELVFLQKMK